MSETRVKFSGDDSGDGRLGRRTVLRGVAVGSVGIAGLAAACGSDDGGDETESGGGGTDTEEPSEPTDNGGGNNGGGTALGSTSEVPVGGGMVYADQEVVVTQPTEGEFLGFTAICTHQGCTVGEVADGTINCPCHGSMYSIEDGSVVNGPATQPLESAQVTVNGQRIMLG